MLFRLLVPAEEVDPEGWLQNLISYGWHQNIPPFDRLTQHELGGLLGRVRATISNRVQKKITRPQEALGYGGGRGLRQKKKLATLKMRDAARGNTNRSGAARRARLGAFMGD